MLQILSVQKNVVILQSLSIVVDSPVQYPFKLEDQSVKGLQCAATSRPKSHKKVVRHPKIGSKVS